MLYLALDCRVRLLSSPDFRPPRNGQLLPPHIPAPIISPPLSLWKTTRLVFHISLSCHSTIVHSCHMQLHSRVAWWLSENLLLIIQKPCLETHDGCSLCFEPSQIFRTSCLPPVNRASCLWPRRSRLSRCPPCVLLVSRSFPAGLESAKPGALTSQDDEHTLDIISGIPRSCLNSKIGGDRFGQISAFCTSWAF